jgi:hypothetical protein
LLLREQSEILENEEDHQNMEEVIEEIERADFDLEDKSQKRLLHDDNYDEGVCCGSESRRESLENRNTVKQGGNNEKADSDYDLGCGIERVRCFKQGNGRENTRILYAQPLDRGAYF